MSKVTPQEGKVFIATYGSLRRNMENFRVNEHGNGVYFGTGKTVENYDLYRYGGTAYFPSISLQHNEANSRLVVDVFEAPADRTGLLGSYDRLEGYPDFYNRSEVEIELDNGDTLTAWIYHIDQKQGDPIESGDWCLYKRSDYYETLNSDDEEE